MRCKACNEIMTDREVKRRDGHGGYECMCGSCLDETFHLDEEEWDQLELGLNFEDDTESLSTS